jgi:thiamine-phosphate pyrophosphorylase
MTSSFLKLMLITQQKALRQGDYLRFIETCARAGVTSVQLREKDFNYSESLFFGRELKSILKPYGVPLIVNDHLELALELDAEGLHLGQSDGDILEARKRLGPHKILGLSATSPEHFEKANTLPLDYVGIGAVFPTRSKENAPVLGLDLFQEYRRLSKHPVIGVGGVTDKNAQALMDRGSAGFAVIGAIHRAQNPSQVIKDLLAISNG